jgi:hypothetical protein
MIATAFNHAANVPVQKGGQPINMKTEGATRVCVRAGGLAGYGRTVVPVECPGGCKRLMGTHNVLETLEDLASG